MSQENVEIVRRLFEAWRQGGDAWERGDHTWVVEFFTQVAEWRGFADAIDNPIRRGHDEIRRMADEWVRNFEHVRIESEEFIDAGDHVVVPARVRGRGRASGVVIELPINYVFTLRGGMVERVRDYRERAQALEAAGLRE